MRVELFVRGSESLMVQTTIEPGDKVTPGSQSQQVFSLRDLQGLPYSVEEQEEPAQEEAPKRSRKSKANAEE